MDFSSSVTGIDQLDSVFLNLPKTTRRRALRPALRDAAGIVKQAAQDNLKNVVSPESSGVLENSLAIYNLKAKQGALRVAVQIKRGMVNSTKLVNGEPVRVGLYAAVLDYGKTAQNQAPTGWLRNAAKNNVDKVKQRLTIGIAAEMVNAIKDAQK